MSEAFSSTLLGEGGVDSVCTFIACCCMSVLTVRAYGHRWRHLAAHHARVRARGGCRPAQV